MNRVAIRADHIRLRVSTTADVGARKRLRVAAEAGVKRFLGSDFRERDDGRLAPARVAFEADLFRVHGLVGLEIIQQLARAPGPRAQRTPIVHLARLTFVTQTNDAFRQTGAVVGLDAVRREKGIPPAPAQNLLLPAAGSCRAYAYFSESKVSI